MKSLTNNSKLIALSVLGIISLLLPLLVKNPYMIHLLTMACIAIVLGMTFSMIYSTGLITLGAAAFYAVGAYASTLLAMKLGLSFWLTLPLSITITGIIALGVGSILVRNPGVAFVVLTMVFAHVLVEVVGHVQLLGGWVGFVGIPAPSALGPIRFDTKVASYYLALFLLVLIVLVFHALYTSRIGWVWKTIKLSPHLAETLGINLYRYRLLAFVIASSAAGAVGSFYTHYFQTITPEAFAGWSSIYIQLYAFLGGLEFYILGPAIGAIFMTLIPEFLRVAEEFEPIITGFLLLAIILFFPGGIIGTLTQFPRFGLDDMSARIEKIGKWLNPRGNLTR